LLSQRTLQIPFTGLTRYPITPDLSKLFGLNDNTYAVLITEVAPESPAEKAGIKGGNMTKSISGEIVRVGGDIVLRIDSNESFVKSND
jgi:S1-C subfamily serine protease